MPRRPGKPSHSAPPTLRAGQRIEIDFYGGKQPWVTAEFVRYSRRNRNVAEMRLFGKTVYHRMSRGKWKIAPALYVVQTSEGLVPMHDDIAKAIEEKMQVGKEVFFITDYIRGRMYMYDVKSRLQVNVNTTKTRYWGTAGLDLAALPRVPKLSAAAASKLNGLGSARLAVSPLLASSPRFLESTAPLRRDDPRYPLQQVADIHKRAPGTYFVFCVRPVGQWVHMQHATRALIKYEQKKGRGCRWGFHGTSIEGVCGILSHGFSVSGSSRSSDGKVFVRMHGHGVYVAREGHGHLCLRREYARPDRIGFQHVLMCQTLPGVEYKSAPGDQYSPEGHSGIDSAEDPRMNIFPDIDMNVRVVPRFLIIRAPTCILSI